MNVSRRMATDIVSWIVMFAACLVVWLIILSWALSPRRAACRCEDDTSIVSCSFDDDTTHIERHCWLGKEVP